MKRRELLQGSAALGLFAAMPFPSVSKRDANNSALNPSPLTPPAQGREVAAAEAERLEKVVALARSRHLLKRTQPA